MALDRTLQDGVLDWLKGSAFPSPPATLYLSMHSDTNGSPGAEVSGDLGGRVELDGADLSSTRFLDGQSSGTRQIVNTRAIVTELATATVEVRSFAVWDAPSGGLRLMIGDVVPDVTVVEGDPLVLLQGDLSLRIS